MPTYNLIEKYIVPSTASTVTLGSGGTIPQTYTDLRLLVALRTIRSNPAENFYFYFNGVDSGAGVALMNGGSSSNVQTFDVGDAFKGVTLGDTSAGNTFNSGDFYIPNYTWARIKSIQSATVTVQNTTSDGYNQLYNSIWNNNAAVTSITFRLQFTSFKAGSTFWLYGIKST